MFWEKWVKEAPTQPDPKGITILNLLAQSVTITFPASFPYSSALRLEPNLWLKYHYVNLYFKYEMMDEVQWVNDLKMLHAFHNISEVVVDVKAKERGIFLHKKCSEVQSCEQVLNFWLP
jgi:hypothetical protein